MQKIDDLEKSDLNAHFMHLGKGLRWYDAILGTELNGGMLGLTDG